ncbi:Hypothetical protein CAP_1382 [Chondromyces apiculatus DSM 436]|uniref:Uncharacterized protein n=1 Tax=Chondromyces apiculatus DSM 436 TaxID=1192034 RepID=A0A017SSY9_9BACT|nr:Hypothetical protein CAP_1382 [Chondromyces apiculatus DSM 436]
MAIALAWRAQSPPAPLTSATSPASIPALTGAPDLAATLTRPPPAPLSPTPRDPSLPSAVAPPDAPSAAVTASALAQPTPEDVTACSVRHLASDAFRPEAPPPLGWMCAEVDPRRGAARLKQEVVRGGGSTVTTAMKEHALLHWYEMATFAALRARCCTPGALSPGASPSTAARPADARQADVQPAEVQPAVATPGASGAHVDVAQRAPLAPLVSLAPLTLPPSLGTCRHLDSTLDALGAAARGQGDLDEALGAYRVSLQCVIASGAATEYAWRDPPTGNAEAIFRRILGRGAPGSAPAAR